MPSARLRKSLSSKRSLHKFLLLEKVTAPHATGIRSQPANRAKFQSQRLRCFLLWNKVFRIMLPLHAGMLMLVRLCVLSNRAAGAAVLKDS